MNEEKMDELLRLMRSVVPDTSDMSDAGRVGFVYRHNYDPVVQYEELDVVKYGMSLWTPKTVTIGNSPPDQSQEGQENVEENEFWRLFLPGALGDDYVKKTDLAVAPTDTDPGKPGIVMPDGKTIQIGSDGLLTGTPLDFMGTWKELQEGLASGEVADGMIGYIEGSLDDTEDPDHPNNMLIKIDDYLSLVSSNAVQNRIITAALNKVKELAEQNAQIIEETRALRASIEAFGLAKECPVDLVDATVANSMFLGAQEKNPAVNGSIANMLQKLIEPETITLAAGEMISLDYWSAYKMGRICIVSAEFVLQRDFENGSVVLSGIPTAARNNYFTFLGSNNLGYSMAIYGGKSELIMYFPAQYQGSGQRIDASFSYITSE